MSRAVLSLGSNLGDRFGYLLQAVAGFRTVLVSASPVYETVPWGVIEQPDFLNAVITVEDPEADAWEWLRRGQGLEAAAGRVRQVRWGPRTLDVDVVTVLVDGETVRSGDPALLLPHPGTPVRASVLRPWLDLEPEAVLTGHGPIAELWAALDATERAGVRLRPDLILPGSAHAVDRARQDGAGDGGRGRAGAGPW